jgi:pilus assembly protein CpaB
MSYRVRNILIAVVLAAIAVALTAVYVTNYRKDVEQGRDLVTVLVAEKDIAVGTPGSEIAENLVSKEVERRNVVPGAITNATQVANLVAAQPVYAGEQVTARRFEPVEQQGVHGQLSGTLRAVSVPGDTDQILVGTLKAGDHVDVVANIPFKVDRVNPDGTPGSSEDRVATRTILRDLTVLGASTVDTDGGSLSDGGIKTYSVVLALTDAQSQKLFFAMKNGDWWLALRPSTDPADSPESVETVESVLGDGLKADQIAQLVYGFGGKENR